MDKRIVDFLDAVCLHIRCREIHKDIRDEITNHIDELTEEYEKQGYDNDRAIDMAISAMGDCDKIGRRLDKQHRPRTEWSLIGLTAIIAVIGGIVMFTSSKFESGQAVSFQKYLLFSVVGVAVLAGMYLFDYTRLKKLALPMYFIALLMVLFSIFTGAKVNGRSYLVIGRMTISSDYTLIMFMAAIAGFIEKSRSKGGKAFAGVLVLAFISLLAVMALPSYSTAIVLAVCYVVLILTSVIKNHFGGNRKTQLASLGGISVFVFCCISYYITTRPDRILSFITRGKSDPSGAGYAQIMADKWLAASSLLGKTTGTVNGYYIDKGMPDLTTSYVLVNIIATLGWVVGIALILAVAVYIGRMFLTTRKIKNNFGLLLSLGASTTLSVQFILCILVNLNLFPLMSTNMPFVSYGGVGYAVNMALAGLILSIWRRNNVIGTSPKAVVEKSKKFIVFEDGRLIINFKA